MQGDRMWISYYKILYARFVIGSSSENTHSPGNGSAFVGLRGPGCSATIMWGSTGEMLNHRVTHLVPPCVCVYKHQCTSLCRSPVCSANRLTSPVTSAGLSPAAASFLGLQISVPLRDPGPSHSQPALSGGAEGFWSSCDPDPDKCDPIRLSAPAGLWSTVIVTPQRLPGRQRDRLWKAAEACHVTDTHLSPPWNTQMSYWGFYLIPGASVLMGIRSLMRDWAKHQVSDLSSGSGFSF